MKGFKLDKCQRRRESRDDGQNGCRYRDSERERPIRSLRHHSSPSSPNSGIRNNPEQGRLYGDEASLAASGHAQESAFERKSRRRICLHPRLKLRDLALQLQQGFVAGEMVFQR